MKLPRNSNFTYFEYFSIFSFLSAKHSREPTAILYPKLFIPFIIQIKHQYIWTPLKK